MHKNHQFAVYLRLVRFPNLGIIVLTQMLFYFFIKITFEKSGVSPLLDHWHFSLLILTTVLIAASGYIINDIIDEKIDRINKPDKMLIGTSISIKRARWYYVLTILTGGAIALYLALYIQNPLLFLIYPVAVFLLYCYSAFFKKQALTGNIIVALYSAFVAGIIWFAERAAFNALQSDYGLQIKQLFIFYMSFAFLSSLFREIVKDMEDIEGDRQEDCKTLPIVIGMKACKFINLFIGSSLLGTMIYWLLIQWFQFSTLLKSATILMLVVPMLYILFIFQKANSKADFHQVSQITKILMVLGLIYLMIFLC